MSFIKKILPNPLKKSMKKLLGIKKPKKGFEGSKIYWENRYVNYRDSGPGSYGRLADFKAEILNSFVKENNIKTVIEYGCGDGNQLSLSNYLKYIGYDVSNKAIAICENRFSNDSTKQFKIISSENKIYEKAELTLSLDVLFHLIEDEVFNEYMQRLFESSTKYVIIYSSNYEAFIAPHVRCREFTKWISANVSENWALQQKIDNRYPFDEEDPDNTSFADFYIYKRM
ncbi:hypothetical protein QRD02_12915 [Aequorivita sp. SDUM287046]|uniref:Class I SAM-dependent methyltransferase n=1 Tax=Aequorivita aurantiaca TaxID=3053356 RepID=A0ABT8DIR5_9FLAO|nr:hypothetical protein [Aequorivita aurantiaca]MDN3725282.1 hypothetical protein [Aequorivita aurantiaca]